VPTSTVAFTVVAAVVAVSCDRRVGELDPDRDRHGLCWQCHNQPTDRSGL